MSDSPPTFNYRPFRLKKPCNEGSIMLVDNHKKRGQGANPKAPDFVGELTVGGVRYAVSVWARLSPRNSRFLSGSVRVMPPEESLPDLPQNAPWPTPPTRPEPPPEGPLVRMPSRPPFIGDDPFDGGSSGDPPVDFTGTSLDSPGTQ